MLVTHGGRKAKRFNWVLQDDYVKIKNENDKKSILLVKYLTS